MVKFTATSADWTKKIIVNKEEHPYEEIIFEAATKAVEWALTKNKEVGLFVEVEDERVEDKSFCVLSFKVLCNAGFHGLAEMQRLAVQEEYQIDLAENIELGKLINKLNKASKKKLYCIAEMVAIPNSKGNKKTAVVCIKLGVYDNSQEARAKCKELNICVKTKKFVVKELTLNNSAEF